MSLKIKCLNFVAVVVVVVVCLFVFWWACKFLLLHLFSYLICFCTCMSVIEILKSGHSNESY